jgi:hypothetical protein
VIVLVTSELIVHEYVPRRKVIRCCPEGIENTLITVPLVDAVAKSVASELKAKADIGFL